MPVIVSVMLVSPPPNAEDRPSSIGDVDGSPSGGSLRSVFAAGAGALDFSLAGLGSGLVVASGFGAAFDVGFGVGFGAGFGSGFGAAFGRALGSGLGAAFAAGFGADLGAGLGAGFGAAAGLPLVLKAASGASR
jgi:hypothetical protein